MDETAAYLDYNATAPVRPEVIEAVRLRQEIGGNPSSVHALGRDARSAVERAREQVAALINARPDQVVFTSGGTESNNLALNGLGARRLAVSAVEHGSVLAAALVSDPDALILAVDGAGRIAPESIAEALADRGREVLVSVMLANNETGIINPVREIAAAVYSTGGRVHCDAIQAVGKIPVDFADLGIDLMSLSAHKIGGPQGVGALIVADNVELAARVMGGGQERGLRAGTENVPGIVGFGVAAEICAGSLSTFAKLADWRDDLERGLKGITAEALVIGEEVSRLPNTSCVTMPGVASETQVIALDLAGIAVSAGAACSSGKVARSHVLDAMGLKDDIAGCAIRVSLGWNTKKTDLDRLYEAWSQLYARTHNEPLTRIQPAA